MLIFVLAVAMTVLMLIATAFSIHQEAQALNSDANKRRKDDFRAFARNQSIAS